jgi:predicted amidohydrolase YtcJ
MVGMHQPRAIALLAALLVAVACSPSPVASPDAPATGSTAPAASPSAAGRSGSLVLEGRIVTMAEPAIAEALLIEDGLVTAVGSRQEIEALADDRTPVIDLGSNVAYPGFIDAHGHWIGDRDVYGVGSAPDAMAAALARGWTSIAELWVNPERLAELESLAAADGLPLRVDAYLALNEPAPSGRHLGDWYADRSPGPVTDRLRVQGLKITLDNGWGTIFHWHPDELTAAIRQANAAGWQVAIHTVSTEAHEMVLDAYESVLGATGPNPLRHRIDHAIQVSDAQLARMVALQAPAVVHLDAAAADWLLEADYQANLGEDATWLTRWRDFVEAGLHVAAATDTPWIYPGHVLTDDIGRPVDQVAGGMDARGRAHPEPPPWMAAQLLSAEQGLRAVTLDAAYALGDEAHRGRLAAGTYADVTILSGDATGGGSPDEIRAMSVVGTIVGGRVAFCAAAEVCATPP